MNELNITSVTSSTQFLSIKPTFKTCFLFTRKLHIVSGISRHDAAGVQDHIAPDG